MLRTLLLASLFLLGAGPGPRAGRATAPAPPAVDELADLVAEVERRREETDLEVLDRLAALGTPEAAQAMVGLYDGQGSLYVRIELVRRMSRFDGVDGAGEVAMRKLTDLATLSDELEVREAALDALAASPEEGRDWLRQIVESPAEDEVRERAMALHVEGKTPEDAEWYRKLYAEQLGGGGKDKKKGRKKEEEDEKIVHRLPDLAHQAFGALVADLEEKELKEALEGDSAAVQYLALDEYAGRSLKKAVKYAEDLYDHPETPVRLRILAAQLLKEASGKKALKRFVEDAGKFATPEPLRVALAELVADVNDSATNKKLARSVTKGKPYEKRFALRALVNDADEGLLEDARELLGDEDASVRTVACEFLVRRGDAASAPAIEAMMAELTNPVDVSLVMDQLGRLLGKDDAWEAKLLAFVGSEDVEVRNAALTQLGRDRGAEHLDLLVENLGSAAWSTRLACLKGLVAMRDRRVIGPIVERMQAEYGRMKVEFADGLFELTGQPFRTAEKSWLAWWKGDGKDSDVISLAELEKAREREELRRLKQVTNSRFFGIRIVSHRVVFIIDVSGSMEEPMRVDYRDSDPETRMTVAKRELTRAIRSLEQGALFNIITFSSGVDSWLDDGVMASGDTSRDEAEAFVARLTPGGATNLYDSLRLAFEDEDVDTIFVLSDGEPTAGEVTDVGKIREDVRAWNEHRGIEINTIGIGGRLDILQWLSEDSGGKHVKFR
jgi:HEAT repeat protein